MIPNAFETFLRMPCRRTPAQGPPNSWTKHKASLPVGEPTCPSWTNKLAPDIYNFPEGELESPLVRITVGGDGLEDTNDKDEYLVHTGILAHHSAYFKAAFRGPFKEAETMDMSFPEDDLAAFDLLLYWVFSGKLPENSYLNNPKLAMALVRLWVLADKYIMPALKNRLIDIFYQAEREVWPSWFLTPSLLSHLWGEIPEESQLRDLVLTMLEARPKRAPRNDQDQADLYPKDLLVQFFRRKQKARFYNLHPPSWSNDWDLCKFHDHRDLTP